MTGQNTMKPKKTALPSLAGATGSVVSRLPKLRIMRDSDPITGEVWVVDENNHCVASFRVMLPECHMAGATTENMHASRNKVLADALIEHLMAMWDIERCPPNTKGQP